MNPSTLEPPRMPRRATARRLALVVGIGLAASACVQPKDPGVSIASLQSNIVFGVKPKETVPKPPGVIPEFLAEEEPDLPEEMEDLEDTTRPTRPPLPNVQVQCPRAKEDAFPEKAAGPQSEGQVASGRYLWQQEGLLGSFEGFKVPLPKFSSRIISGVSQLTRQELEAGDPVDPTKPATLTEYTYQVRRADQRGLNRGGAYFVDSYKVRSSPLVQRVTPPVAPVPLPASNVATGDPERGLVLTKVEEFSGRTDTPDRGVFTPTPGVLLLPLPVITGEVFESAGVDPQTGATLHIQGTVGSRKQVDACGEMIDGWEVVATQTFTEPEGGQSTTNYTYIVATQYGSLMTFEKLTSGAGLNQSEPQVFTIGQLRPSVPK